MRALQRYVSKRNRRALMLGLLMSGAATPAFAQSASTAIPNDEAAQTEGLSDIVVTARKRSENLQDVPIATTALSPDQLLASGVSRSDQLQQLTPNLTIGGGFETIPKITIRGIGTNDFIQNLNPAVGTYVDEVYFGLATGQLLQLYDIDRVEVLRGPQGTLYGKNTTGGAINVFSAAPRIGQTSGGVSATYGNYNFFSTEGHLNLPLGDTAALRVSATTRDRDGYFKNDFNGERDRYQDVWNARAQLLVEPSDAFSARFKLYGGKTNVDALHRIAIGVLDPAVPGRYLVGGVDAVGYRAPQTPHRGAHDAPTYDNVDEAGGSANLRFDLGGPELTSITAYTHVSRRAQDDPDGSPFAMIRNFYGNKSSFLSQELRLAGENGALDWIVGAHYYREKHFVFDDFNFFECSLNNSCTIRPNGAGYAPGNTFPGGPLAGVPIASNVLLTYNQRNVSYAGFGEGKLRLADNFSVTAGLRYTSETRTITSSSITSLIARPSVASPFFPGYASFVGDRTWDNLSYRVIAEYKPSADILLYGSYSTGFRSGNWNGVAFARIQSVQTPVNPEELRSAEIGAKMELLDNRLRLNLSAFYSKYDDLQVSIFVNATSVLANATTATIKGAEAELTAIPVRGLTLRLATGYLDANYGTFCDNAAAPVDPKVPFRAGCGNDLSGNQLVNAPKFTGSLSADYQRPLSNEWTFSIGGDVRYQSKVFFTAFNLEHLSQDAYALANVRMKLANTANNYSISVWATNVFNREYGVDGNQIRAPFGMDLKAFGPPRFYGVTVAGKF